MRPPSSSAASRAAALLLVFVLRGSGAVPAAVPPPAATAGPPAAASAAQTAVNAPETDVALVHAIFRHGARTPVDTYPNDPYINITFAPVGWGQLTNKGKMMQYQQGKFLRERYDALLGPLYSPRVIEARSTDKDRTKMSALLELAGLWPPQGDQRWNPSLNWQPIPVHSVPVPEDHLLLGYSPCPGYYEKRDAVLASDEVKSQLEALNATILYEVLTNITGLQIANPDDLQSLYSTLTAEQQFGLTLPEWSLEYYPEKLETITALSFEYNAYTKELQKIKGGPLLKKIVEDAKEKINGTLERKFFMYAGHDSTIVNLLMSLGVWDTQVPGYGILTLVELHQEKENGNYGIKVFLRNSTEEDPYALEIPGCGHYCPFPKFEELTMETITLNWDELCQINDPNYVPPSSSPI
ncbi:hypothetical protein R5R35_003832 [Gryllus longicercus]|uniref:Prostatic acid phosphatase n=1 Tax=Gryllus longicercus TaxID=2509291 RepID=A0AAN9Z453_9ORTH